MLYFLISCDHFWRENMTCQFHFWKVKDLCFSGSSNLDSIILSAKAGLFRFNSERSKVIRSSRIHQVNYLRRENAAFQFYFWGVIIQEPKSSRLQCNEAATSRFCQQITMPLSAKERQQKRREKVG
jgi:hypothetical protein